MIRLHTLGARAPYLRFSLPRQWYGISARSKCTSSSKLPLIEIKNNIIRNKQNIYVPEEPFYNFMMRRLAAFEDRVALVNGITKETYLYRDVYNLSRKFGAALMQHGLQPESPVAILSFNRPEYAMAVLGVQGCQVIATGINPSYTVDEIVFQLKDSQARFLVLEEGLLEKGLQAADIVGLDKVFILGDSNINKTDVVRWDTILEMDEKSFPTEVDARCLDDTILLLYSSGTTGRSKGVMLTHRNIMAQILQLSFVAQNPVTRIALGLLPFYHSYGLMVSILLNLYEGKKVVTLPSFIPETFLNTIVDYKIEVINLVPPLVIFLTKDKMVKEYDLSHVKEATIGAAPCAANLFDSMQKTYPHTFVRQGYGLTETSPVATLHQSFKSRAGSSGVPLIGTEIKIEDIDSRIDLGPNKEGEVCIRGPLVMKGYLNRPEETAQILTKDNWLLTGDIGYYDTDGHIYIVDRLKELIKYKGLQVAPAEIEDVLLSHPAVSEAAVIGIENEEAGEIPRAYVVLIENIAESELIDFVSKKVAPHKRLRGGVKFIDSIPKAPSGKILRRLLRDNVAVDS